MYKPKHERKYKGLQPAMRSRRARFFIDAGLLARKYPDYIDAIRRCAGNQDKLATIRKQAMDKHGIKAIKAD